MTMVPVTLISLYYHKKTAAKTKALRDTGFNQIRTTR